MNSLNDFLQTTPPAARAVLTGICEAQRRHRLFSSYAGAVPLPVVLGFSGGADSVCLLHALWALAPYLNLTLHAAHLDHALREESAGDADFAADFAAQLGMPFHLHRLNPGQLSAGPANIESAARIARYAFLAQVAHDVAAPHASPTVAVAHHMNDQAETVLMNLVRGSGLRGLGAMPWTRTLEVDGTDPSPQVCLPFVLLVRPLLRVQRSQILDYLRAYGLPYVEDHTNQDANRLRNGIRHEALPALAKLNPAIVETLARTADILATEADRAGLLDGAALDELTIETDPTLRYVLDLAGLLRLHPAGQRGVLRLACERMHIDTRDLGFDTLDDVLQMLNISDDATGPHTWAEDVDWTVLPADSAHSALLALHRRGKLPWQPPHPLLCSLRPGVSLPAPILAPGRQAVTPQWSLHAEILEPTQLPPHWRQNTNQWRAFLDADQVSSPLLTTPTSGMRIAPLGMSGQSKGLGDYFTDRKTPLSFRACWPVVVDAATNAVIWLCGHTISHDVRLTERTRRVLLLEWLPADASPPFTASEERPCFQT